MDDTHTHNAMTEIALALAMGFFSIMVLTMVSMGAGAKTDAAPAVAAMLAPAQEDAKPAALAEVGGDDVFVVFHRGRFFDRELRPLDPAGIAPSSRVILALDPRLPMADAVAARGRIDVPDLIVSTLDARWLETLKRLNP